MKRHTLVTPSSNPLIKYTPPPSSSSTFFNKEDEFIIGDNDPNDSMINTKKYKKDEKKSNVISYPSSSQSNLPGNYKFLKTNSSIYKPTVEKSKGNLSHSIPNVHDLDDKKYIERYRVYNPNNKLITEEFILNILKNGGLNFDKIKNISIFQTAFTHTSYTINNTFKKYNIPEEEKNLSEKERKEIVSIQTECWERLEWLGDAILQMVSAIFLFERFTKADEGFLTKNRSKLVRTEMLAKLSTKLQMSKYVLMSYHVENYCDGRKNEPILEDVFESFIGALYIECKELGRKNALDICFYFISNIFNRYIPILEVIQHDDNYKDRLMRYFHKMHDGFNPIYEEDQDSNPQLKPGQVASGPRFFKSYVIDKNGKRISEGIGKNLKKAEQDAARNALIKYGLITIENDTHKESFI